MARVKRGVAGHKRHKRLLQAAEGRRGSRHKLIRPAREALLHALAYATRDRQQRKRQMRELWIHRVNAAARLNGISYSQFIAGLKRTRCRGIHGGRGRSEARLAPSVRGSGPRSAREATPHTAG
ncbi:MAG: 50S ribosomal protein L20 [Candidatus Aquidulcis sp.]|nr:MAG: 50S ribosomal protein L20 [Candidatus Aquidulcis sp.]